MIMIQKKRNRIQHKKHVFQKCFSSTSNTNPSHMIWNSNECKQTILQMINQARTIPCINKINQRAIYQNISYPEIYEHIINVFCAIKILLSETFYREVYIYVYVACNIVIQLPRQLREKYDSGHDNFVISQFPFQ